MSRLRLIIHAPTENALTRARSNAANLLAAAPGAQIEIVVNGPGVAAALATPHESDPLLRVCGNTLSRMQRTLPDGLIGVPAAVLHIAERQRDGWAYMRA
ncbi:MAG: hypothetical protein PF501_07800 [Salinisphaera sp.]|jgi:intracellular sulfur oxidation DsrE/DsrF family protein|nr:hypothetical protein [Salinisphaera sp.]